MALLTFLIIPLLATGQTTVTALPGEGQPVPGGTNSGTSAPPQIKPGSATTGAEAKPQQGPPVRDYSRQDGAAMDYDPNKANLTDQEYNISKQHHTGKAQREFEDKCIKVSQETDPEEQEKIRKACAGQDAAGGGLKMVGMISKAYTMVVGFGGIGDTYKVKDPQFTKENQKTEERKDYCKYIAVASEAIAMFQQMSAQNNLQNTAAPPGEHQQIANLEKAKLSHIERSKTAKIQAYGWGATLACYTATIASTIGPGIAHATDIASLVIKAAASGVFLAFAIAQVNAHMDYANKIDGILANFQAKNGNCNPITERKCYCAEPDTQSDPKYCVPYLHERKLAASALRISCINNQMKPDPKCSCAQTDTCFDQTFFNMTSGLNFGDANDPIKKTVAEMSKGQITGGARLNTGELKRNAARNMAQLRDTFDKLPGSNLNSAGIKEAKELAAFADLPPSAAMALVAQPMTAESHKNINNFRNAMASYLPSSNYLGNSGGMGRSNALYFGGGGGNLNKNKEAGFNSDMFKLSKKGGEQKANFLNFQEKATQAAQINKRSEGNLFEIISRRYQVTGRRVLEIKE